MSGTTRVQQSSRLAGPVATALVASLAFAVMATPASAQQFLAGQSDGMNRCVRAILRGYTEKRVNVHGHHFNCYPLRRFENGRRVISLRNNRRLRRDHSFTVNFRVNRVGAREYIRNNSARVRIVSSKDILDIFPPYRFRGPSRPGTGARDYDSYVRGARQVRPREEKNWETVARQIATIVIATLGEPWP